MAILLIKTAPVLLLSNWIFGGHGSLDNNFESEENNFDFTGPEAASEAGHIANLANQLRAVLYEIRMETMKTAPVTQDVSELRKCPHCGEVWARVG